MQRTRVRARSWGWSHALPGFRERHRDNALLAFGEQPGNLSFQGGNNLLDSDQSSGIAAALFEFGTAGGE